MDMFSEIHPDSIEIDKLNFSLYEKQQSQALWGACWAGGEQQISTPRVLATHPAPERKRDHNLPVAVFKEKGDTGWGLAARDGMFRRPKGSCRRQDQKVCACICSR